MRLMKVLGWHGTKESEEGLSRWEFRIEN
jgi:hypothetical protein